MVREGVFVIIEKMHTYLVLTQKIKQGTIGIQRTENVQLIHHFYWDEARLLLHACFVNRGKYKGVVLSA